MDEGGVMEEKYYIASYDSYYPGGGLGDIYGAYDTAEAAIADADAYAASSYRSDWNTLIKIEGGLIYELAYRDFSTDGWEYYNEPLLHTQFFVSAAPKSQ